MCGESMLWRVFLTVYPAACLRLLIATISDVCSLVPTFFLSTCTAFCVLLLSVVLISALFFVHLRLAFDGEQHSSGKMGFCFLRFLLFFLFVFFRARGNGRPMKGRTVLLVFVFACLLACLTCMCLSLAAAGAAGAAAAAECMRSCSVLGFD
jgi:phosphoglycerol transferase MdoB-like AlkP superfamily enzyme